MHVTLILYFLISLMIFWDSRPRTVMLTVYYKTICYRMRVVQISKIVLNCVRIRTFF
jgi:hypothetical protein